MPTPTTASTNSFTICKIEAGRALLLSSDLELVEFPVNLLPSSAKAQQVVEIDVKNSEILAESLGTELLKSVAKDYSVSREEIEALRQEVKNGEFLSIEEIGCTAAIVSWNQKVWQSKPAVKLEFVDLFDGNRLFISSLPHHSSTPRFRLGFPQQAPTQEVSVHFRTSCGSFWSEKIVVSRRPIGADDFAGVFLITDLTPEDQRLQVIRERGGRIFRSGHPSQHPITAVVTDSMSSSAFNEALSNNLPAVSTEWLNTLVIESRLGAFSDFPVLGK